MADSDLIRVLPGTGPTSPPTAELLDQLGLAYVLNNRQGHIVDLNQTFVALSGYPVQELLGQSYHNLFAPPTERDLRRTAYLTCIRTGQLQPTYERVFCSSTGNQHLLQWQTGFTYDENGKISGIWAAGREITNRSVAIGSLADNRSHLQDFLDNAQDLVQHLNAENAFLFVNKAWKEKLGYTDEELASRTLADVVHPYYKAKLFYQLRNLYDGEPVNRVETVFLTSSGKPVHLIGSMSCVREPGQPVTTRAILHDITDRIKAERLQKVYYSIANLAISAKTLTALYGAIHRELSKILETSNLFLALCDDARTELQFVYLVDQNPSNRPLATRPFSSGLSEYIIEGGQPRFLTREELQQLVLNGEITAYGQMPEVLLASPLSIGERIIGVIVVQDYQRPDAFAPADLDILHFISSQVALAIERKRNEEQISRQSARLNAIFESGSHMMWTVDMKSRLMNFNRNYAAVFLRRNGTHPQRGLNLWETDLARMEEPTRQLFIENYQAAAQGRPQRFEVKFRDTRGHDLWADIHLNPIYMGDGSFEEISAIAHDITEQKRAQIALQAEEEKFRSIFESFQDIYYRTDDQAIITLVSPSVQEVLGYKPEEVVGKSILDYYHDVDDRERLLTEVHDSGRLRNFEIQMRHAEGYPVSLLVNARRSPNGGIGTEGIARDVTEIRQMQDDLSQAKDEAETALEAKTQFLANMSHELRTPMNGIIGMIDLLDQTVGTEEQIEYVDTLRKSSDALLTILNDILDLSKMQAGKMQVNAMPLELRSVLERIRSLFSYRAEQKGIRFTYHVTPHTPAFVLTDEIRLLQILSNLVANAIKFTTEGTVSIVVSSVSTDGEDHTLRFAVQDSGIGISPHDAALLFTNFTQLDTTPSKTYGGTGLGLAISRQLAELLGGEIGVLSDLGQGSVFWFTIQCREVSSEERPSANAVASRETRFRPFATPPKVLLVDDNPINQKVGQRLLSKLGCVVDVAGGGPEAIAFATNPDPNSRYDIIFMDIQMPEMDGIAATRAIREHLGPYCPPVVAMTAYSMQEDAGRFMRQGLDDYVGKPVKSRHLYEVLHRWLRPGPSVEATAETVAVKSPEVVPNGPETMPTLDLSVLRQLQELGGNEFAISLYEEFEQEAGQLIREGADMAAAVDVAALLPMLHQLKGTAATLGATALAGQARHLERQLKDGNTTELSVGFQLLEHYFAQLLAAYPNATGLSTPASS